MLLVIFTAKINLQAECRTVLHRFSQTMSRVQVCNTSLMSQDGSVTLTKSQLLVKLHNV